MREEFLRRDWNVERLLIDFWGKSMNDAGIGILNFPTINRLDFIPRSAGSRSPVNRLTTSLGFQAASCNTLIDLFRH